LASQLSFSFETHPVEGDKPFTQAFKDWEGDALEPWQSVKNGFPTRLNGNKVGIDKGKTSRVIVREKLSKRAVLKEDGLGRVYLQERRLTPIGT